EVQHLGRLEVSRGLFDIPLKSLPPLKADGHRPREAACELAQPHDFVVSSCGKHHLPNRDVLGTLNVALADGDIAVSAQRPDHLSVRQTLPNGEKDMVVCLGHENLLCTWDTWVQCGLSLNRTLLEPSDMSRRCRPRPVP